MRQIILLRSLAGKHPCISYGVEEAKDSVEKADSLKQAVRNAENILLPIPMCKGERLNIQQEVIITKEELLSYIRKGQRIFAGCIEENWKKEAEKKGAVCYDYMTENTIAIYNSIATAEGTIAEIIRTYPQNLHGTKVLITGFGRCAKTLAAKLKGLDVRVSIAARNKAALMEAFANGYDAVDLKELTDTIAKYPVIVNTVPERILTDKELSVLKKDTLIYEIASLPYGVDVEAAKELGITVFLCPSLPAKYAPVSSAEVLRQYIIKKQEGNT